MALQFKNGKFRVLMIADTQEGTKVSSDTLNLINAALDRAQPDFVIYSGDQIWGKRKFKGNKDEVKRVLHELCEPVISRKIPFAICFGNHDRQVGVSNSEQFEIYKEVLSRMEGKKVIIRTLDIGADKQVDYFKLPKEENPAMGYRAIRICLDRIDVFKTQLRAIYRASVYGTAAIMFPMIISVKEILRIKEIVEEVKAELTAAGIEIAPVELGIMVETPAAVMISEELAKEVSFFSIGTNDLTQYTLAIDRQNQKLDAFYDPHHPAVLAMIRMAAENAHAEGKWIGICGELGADLELTEEFLSMGLDELSVSPAMVLPLRKKIRETK